MENNKNFILFLVLTFGLLFGWMALQSVFGPQKPKEPAEKQQAAQKEREAKPQESPKEKPTEADWLAERVAWAAGDAARVARAAATPRPVRKLIPLGTDSDNLRAVLDTHGAAVRSVVLNKFPQADRLGRPEWLDAEKKIPKPLELVEEELNRDSGSFLLFDF